MSKFKYEPSKIEVDRDQIKWEDQRAFSNGENGKGDAPRHNPRVYGPKYENINWKKND